MNSFHPDLALARFIPGMSYGPLSSRVMRSLKVRPADPGPDVTVREVVVPGPQGAPAVSLRVFQPAGPRTATPALLWIHGGGLIFGSPEQDDRTNVAFVRKLGITVAAAVEDVYAALRGLVARADELHVIPGAFHGFDAVFPKAEISRQFWRLQAEALSVVLSVTP